MYVLDFDTYSLAFTARQLQAALSNLGFVLVREGKNAVMDVSSLARLIDILLGGVGVGILQVVHDGGVEQHRVLRHNTNVPPEAVNLEVPEVVPVDGDRAVLDVVEAEEQL